MTTATKDTVLAQALIGSETLLWKLALVLGGSALIAISAQISVPMIPVPMTLQTLAVLLVGLTFGSRLGAIALIAYLAEGAMGLPVFAGGKFGIATLMGPTGGYLFGFVAAAFLTGWLAERGWDRSVLRTALAMAIGNVVIYLPGLIQLQLVTGAEWAKVWTWGAGPFLIGDAVKLVIAALAVPGVWRLLGKARH